MSTVQVLYRDVAPGAAQNAQVSAPGAESFSQLSALLSGVSPPPVLSLEKNLWALDGTFEYAAGAILAFWSTALSGADGCFAEPPVITVSLSGQYSSLGLTLAFDRAAGDFCSGVNIKWYQETALLAEGDFAPDAPLYFCEQRVTAYDRVVITLKQTAKPYRRAKLEQILFGVHRTFGMTELRQASAVQEMDLLAQSVPVSTFCWTVESPGELDFMFQLKQPVEVLNTHGLVGVYYIDGHTRLSRSVYDISCYDAVGVLGESRFPGGVYQNQSARALFLSIVGGSFAVDFEAPDVSLTGILQPCTRREAMQQVLFAWGACCSTDGRDSIRVFVPGDEPAVIGEDSTYSGARAETAAMVTRVEVTAHAYTQSDSGSVEIGGVKYADEQTVFFVDNPDVTVSDKQNVVQVTGATLVSPAIGQQTAQRVYDYYARRSTGKAKIVWTGQRLGDRVSLPNGWGGTEEGNIVKMEISLSNTVAAALESR